LPEDLQRVLVTGASGFIGRACLPRLSAHGFELHAVSSKARANDAITQWHRYDLLDPAQCRSAVAAIRPTHLLHLAWIATPGRFWTSPDNTQWLDAGTALAEAFFDHGGTRAVGVGTCAEYAQTNDNCSEDMTPLAPESMYGRSKLALSQALFAAAKKHGGSAAWARLFLPYGPGEAPDRLIPAVIRALLARQPVDCTAGTQVRDPVFVDDIADALTALLASPAQGAYNVGGGKALSLREIVDAIVKQLGHEELVRFGARQPPLNDPQRTVADVSRIARDVGWEPRVDLDTGIARSIAYWRERSGAKESQ
jgi:nucleoside-diphosphate-sugar epimerase